MSATLPLDKLFATFMRGLFRAQEMAKQAGIHMLCVGGLGLLSSFACSLSMELGSIYPEYCYVYTHHPNRRIRRKIFQERAHLVMCILLVEMCGVAPFTPQLPAKYFKDLICNEIISHMPKSADT